MIASYLNSVKGIFKTHKTLSQQVEEVVSLLPTFLRMDVVQGRKYLRKTKGFQTSKAVEFLSSIQNS